MSTIFEPVPSSSTSTGGIQAYANVTSVVPGDTIYFHVWVEGATSHDPAAVSVVITREEENPVSVTTFNGYAYEQTTNDDPWLNGCGWVASQDLQWTVPDTDPPIPSGAYKAVLTSGSASTSVLFFVKSADPGANAKILYVSPVTSWEAYNDWGGKSLYGDEYGNFQNRARKVSFNRPQRPFDFNNWEIAFIHWFYREKRLENLPEDLEIDFCTSIDIQADSTIVDNYNLVLSVGHDEYWSWEMRDTVEDFVTDNGNAAFLGGNTCWWQVRFEAQEGDNRLMVCYKDYQEDHDANPTVPDDHITINWFEKIIQRPENLMIGASYYLGTALWASYTNYTSFKVRLQKHWLLKDTDLVFGDSFGNELFNEFETDSADFGDYDRKFPIATGKLAYDSDEFSSPKDLMVLAAAKLTDLGDGGTTGYWNGPNYHSGWATIGIFRKPDGGFVVQGGVNRWASIGLSGSWNEFGKITKNVLQILGDDFVEQAFLLVNPGFEDWSSGLPVGWVKTGGGTVSQETGYEGNYSALINATSGGDTFLSQQYIPVRTNRSYRVRCYANHGGSFTGPGAGTAISIRLETLDLYDAPIQTFVTASYPSTSDGWLEISADGSITHDEDIMIQARVKVYVKSGYSGYFDSVVVEEL